MFEALLAISERDGDLFHMEDSADEIRVYGPRNEAVYPADCWVSRFARHVYSGYFEHAPRESGNDRGRSRGDEARLSEARA